jgi:hypothetical protein
MSGATEISGTIAWAGARGYNLTIRPMILITFGLGWLATDLYLMVGNVILRETRLGPIAQLLDRLPLRIANPIFLFLWAVFLLGWTVPLILGFRLLFRAIRSNRPTTLSRGL